MAAGAHPRVASLGLRPSPFDRGSRSLKGKALREGQAPPLRRKTNPERWFGRARRRSETAPFKIFRQVSPQWGGRNRGAPLHLCAPEISLNLSGEAPVNGGPGESRHGERSSPLRRPPAAFWLLCRRGQSNPPSADGGIPCKTARRGRRALRPEKGCSLIAPSSVWPSASHLPPRGKAFAGEGLRAADSRPYRENSVEIPHLHKILRGS